MLSLYNWKKNPEHALGEPPSTSDQKSPRLTRASLQSIPWRMLHHDLKIQRPLPSLSLSDPPTHRRRKTRQDDCGPRKCWIWLDNKRVLSKSPQLESCEYHLANWGVKPRQGGHQWALKYNAKAFFPFMALFQSQWTEFKKRWLTFLLIAKTLYSNSFDGGIFQIVLLKSQKHSTSPTQHWLETSVTFCNHQHRPKNNVASLRVTVPAELVKVIFSTKSLGLGGILSSRHLFLCRHGAFLYDRVLLLFRVVSGCDLKHEIDGTIRSSFGVIGQNQTLASVQPFNWTRVAMAFHVPEDLCLPLGGPLW